MASQPRFQFHITKTEGGRFLIGWSTVFPRAKEKVISQRHHVGDCQGFGMTVLKGLVDGMDADLDGDRFGVSWWRVAFRITPKLAMEAKVNFAKGV